MQRYATDRRDNEALRRLAVVLLTLASIAESLALRSRPFRAIVLWLLCKAEARAYGLACKTGAGAAFAFPSDGSPVGWLGGAGEAARLAQKFRALAECFFALSRQAARVVRTALRNGSVNVLANFRTVIGSGHWSGPRYRWCTDTS